MGEMADFGMYDDPFYWPHEFSGYPESPQQVSCKYCHKGGLTWMPAFAMPPCGPWRLIDSKGDPHICDEYVRIKQTVMKER